MFTPFGFFSAGSPVVPLAGGTAADSTNLPNLAKAGWRFNPDGSIDRLEYIGGDVYHLDVQRWFNPPRTGIGASYWIRATPTGDAPGGSLTGVWLALTGTATWTLSTTGGSLLVSLAVQIASDAAGTNIVTSGTFVIDVDSTP